MKTCTEWERYRYNCEKILGSVHRKVAVFERQGTTGECCTHSSFLGCWSTFKPPSREVNSTQKAKASLMEETDLQARVLKQLYSVSKNLGEKTVNLTTPKLWIHGLFRLFVWSVGWLTFWGIEKGKHISLSRLRLPEADRGWGQEGLNKMNVLKAPQQW